MGVIFNLILSFTLYFGQASTGGVRRADILEGAVVSQEPRAGAPAYGQLHVGDVVTSVNSRALASPFGSAGAADLAAAVDDMINEIRINGEGKPVKLGIADPSGSTRTIALTPQRATPGANPTIGTVLSPNFEVKLVTASNPGEAFKLATGELKSTVTRTADGLFKVGSDAVKGKGLGGAVSGPIGMIKVGSDLIRKDDSKTVIAFAAALSVNLAVLNSIPLPALDGGQLAILAGEAVARRKIGEKAQGAINALGVSLLLYLSAAGTLTDVAGLMGK